MCSLQASMTPLTLITVRPMIIALRRMVTTAEQVARAVLLNYPFVRCFPCLALQVGVSEKDAREAG